MRASFPRAAFAALALGVIATAACRDDRAAITEPFGSVAYNARLLPAPQGIPGGTARSVAANGVVFGTRTATAASRVFTFTGLDSLVGTNVYQVFVGNRNATTGVVTYAPATGTVYAVRSDTTVDPVTGDPSFSSFVTTTTGTSSFQNGGSNVTVYLVVPNTTFGTSNLVLVTIEPAPGATTPTLSGPRPLWARGTFTTSTALNFGTYNENPANDEFFTATGRGYARFRDNIILVDDSALVRPPVGYYYETHIVARDGGVVDEASSISLGAQTAPAPRRNVSLFDADVNVVDEVVLARSIRAAANRVSVDTLDARAGAPEGFPFAGLSEIVVTLEAKAGRPEVRSPTIVLAGTTPIEVSTPPASGDTR
jgi:hypothetical protein